MNDDHSMKTNPAQNSAPTDKKSKRGGRRPNAGRKKGSGKKDTNPRLSVRVSRAHKQRFFATVPQGERSAWIEGKIDADFPVKGAE